MIKRNKWICLIVYIFFVPMIIYLGLHSLLGTAVLKQFGEHTYYIRDKWWMHILVLSLLIGICVIGKKVSVKVKLPSKMLMALLTGVTVVWAITVSAYIWNVKWYPVDDQLAVYEAARQLIHGNFSQWEPEGYLAENPHQTGLTLIYAVFWLVFKGNGYLWIQQWNVLCYVVGGIALYKVIDLLFHNKLSAAVGYLLYLGFLPLVCYIPFVYGTLPGFAASLVALYYLLLFMQGKKWKWIAYSSVFISFAYLCKTNYVITFIAFVCILFAGEIIEKKKGQYVLAIAALTGCLVFTAFVSNACMESLTGKEVSKGVSTWGRVAMGLQESYRAPGWFNDYVYVNYREAGRDTEAAAENAKVRVKERLLEFSQHPGYFLDFFSKKIASQWNNPSFQGFWNQQMMGWERTDISDEVDEWIQDGRTGNQRIVEIFNIVQSIVLLGTVLYILLNKSIDYKQLVFAVIFIGGFLFHIVWEAKCQYTVVYFVLLIPYCIQGLQLVVQEIMKLITLPLQKINKKKMFVSVVIIALLSLMLMQDNIVITKTLKFYNAASEAEYNEYLKNREGVYHEWQNTK